MKQLVLFCFLLLIWSSSGSQWKADENIVSVDFVLSGHVKLKGELGLALSAALGQPQPCSDPPPGVSQCHQWGDYARLEYTSAEDTGNNCARVEWASTFARRLEDCFPLQSGDHWYGGGEAYRQHWPIEKDVRPEAPMVTGDFFGVRDVEFGGVTENYWIMSKGVAINVDEEVPLYFSLNSTQPGKFCLISQDIGPYQKREQLVLKYSVCLGDDIKSVHQASLHRFYPRPTEIPDERMILYPIWSTWAQYKTEVNQTIVMEFANRIRDEGFKNSQLEIDDDWETCYGEREFNPEKFPNPTQMVQDLKAMDFRVTLWIHPFINFGCPLFSEGLLNSHFVSNSKGKTGITSWWQGGNAGIVDFTKDGARDWWHQRLTTLQNEIGIDSFKFDAGETNWLPLANDFDSSSVDLQPNYYTTKYVDAVAHFGKVIEVRAGRKSQNHPIFTRMLDKDSNWGYENGIKTLIPTLLHFQILGYFFTLPDMIGGNAYGSFPSDELYVRWLQANVFMPSVQISIVPWEYDAQTIQICLDMMALREQFADALFDAFAESVSDGIPINRPLWWLDPSDPETFMIDDEYTLGNDILVAPVLEEGQTSRDIYLPRGQWVSPSSNMYLGPVWLRNYPAPLNILPYFLRYNP